ncbi:hypothetical protein NQZ68_008012 [Dissostichus eleginoides]|nr:hypothetical protein NQZ68_008012 [Dissostichus eleginoides]
MWKAPPLHLRDKAQAVLQASSSIKVSQYSCIAAAGPQSYPLHIGKQNHSFFRESVAFVFVMLNIPARKGHAEILHMKGALLMFLGADRRARSSASGIVRPASFYEAQTETTALCTLGPQRQPSSPCAYSATRRPDMQQNFLTKIQACKDRCDPLVASPCESLGGASEDIPLPVRKLARQPDLPQVAMHMEISSKIEHKMKPLVGLALQGASVVQASLFSSGYSSVSREVPIQTSHHLSEAQPTRHRQAQVPG